MEYFGYRDVNALRTALFRFPDDPIVQAAFYGKDDSPTMRVTHTISFFPVKHNQITQGVVQQGQCARDVLLYTTEGCPTSLFAQISSDQPLLVIAGSTS